MRRNYREDPRDAKQIARERYAERQIEKWCKWSFEVRGVIRWKELMEIIDNYKAKHNG